MDTFYRYCLKGDLVGGYQYLKELAPQTAEMKELLAKYEQVFFSNKPTLSIQSDDPWIREIISIYFLYFIDVLTKKRSVIEGDAWLFSQLSLFLNKTFTSMEELEEALRQEFNQKGYYFLGGKTLPFYGPYIWRQMEVKTFCVDLPLGSQSVDVYLLDDFLMQGWLHFATFGAKSTGGWAKPEGLYCVLNRYTHLDANPAFQISFLKHEAQHYYDLEHYPNLESWELEYRAKLVEMIYGDSSSYLHRFIAEASSDPNYPHLYAANIIKEQYTTKFIDLNCITLQEIRDYALELYLENTKQLEQKYHKG